MWWDNIYVILFFQIELHLLKSHPMQLSIHTLLANSITDGVVVPPVVGSCVMFFVQEEMENKGSGVCLRD